MPLWTRRFWQRSRVQPHHGPHSYTLKGRTIIAQVNQCTLIAPPHATSLQKLSPRRYWLVQPMMGVMAPSFGHGHAGATLGIAATINAVTAVAEERRAAAQQGAMRPAIFPVAEVWGCGSALARPELHRCWFHPPT